MGFFLFPFPNARYGDALLRVYTYDELPLRNTPALGGFVYLSYPAWLEGCLCPVNFFFFPLPPLVSCLMELTPSLSSLFRASLPPLAGRAMPQGIYLPLQRQRLVLSSGFWVLLAIFYFIYLEGASLLSLEG